MTPKDNNNSWDAWRRLVLDKLDQNSADHKAIVEDMHRIQLDIARLKIKSSLWGAAAGMLPALAVLIWQLLGR